MYILLIGLLLFISYQQYALKEGADNFFDAHITVGDKGSLIAYMDSDDAGKVTVLNEKI